jgi:cytidylate kinase
MSAQDSAPDSVPMAAPSAPMTAATERAAPVIAIDGPTASGKGTVAHRVARALGFTCLDSGALYRIVGLLAMEQRIALDGGEALCALAAALSPVFDDGRIWVDGREITEEIRREDVGAAASRVAAVGPLRVALLDLQRRQRRPPGLVADGRDMGTVVFPDAVLKVFLVADVQVRAQRRFKQLMDKGYSATLADLLLGMQERDRRDQSRDFAPLVAAPDARVLDSSALTADAVVAQVLQWYRASAGGS